jgi:O-antigen/teichoic acid export membrane protein
LPDDLGARMARGTLAQQGSQVVGFLAAIAVTTALGRELSLAEFGVYGLVISFTTYLYFALGSAETAAVRAISATDAGADRDRAFSTAIVVYATLGLGAGALIAGVGTVVPGCWTSTASCCTKPGWGPWRSALRRRSAGR